MKKSIPTIGIVKSRVFLTGTAFVLMACSSGEEFAGHSGKGEEPVITPVLCTSGASEQAVKVYDFLRENRNKKTLSGTMACPSWNVNEAEWVYQHTGKYPAIAFFDYLSLEYSPCSWIDYSKTKIVEDWWNKNGLVGAGWHWRVPCVQGSAERHYTPGDGSVDPGTGKRTTTVFSAANATKEGTWENEVVKADLKKLAGYLKLLRDKRIPVIWRPLHEAAGNIYNYKNGKAWFWWGNDGAEAYKKLWIYIFNYFKKEGINNLIWVWTTQTKDSEFYPGDEYVDMVGRDMYPAKDEYTTGEYCFRQYGTITASCPGKLVALSECGNGEQSGKVYHLARISAQWEAGAKWTYFMPWYDYSRTKELDSEAFTATSHRYADKDWWVDAMSQDYVITRDQLPSFK